MRRGSGTIMALLVVSLLLTLSVMLNQLTLVQMRESTLRIMEEQAEGVAKGALNIAICQKDFWQKTEQKRSGKIGLGQYELVSKPLAENTWELVVSGQVQQHKRTLKLRVKKTLLPNSSTRLEWQRLE